MHRLLVCFLSFALASNADAQPVLPSASRHQSFTEPAPGEDPWVFWYGMHGDVSRVGITTDQLEAMRINGIDCGTRWTAPFELDILHTLRIGLNCIEIDVTNTWHHRLLYDRTLPEKLRHTRTIAPFRLKHSALLPSGLAATPVFLCIEPPHPKTNLRCSD